MVAKTSLAAGNAEEALIAVRRIPEQSRNHWLLYLQAKAESALDRRDEALKTAERALELASKDTKAESRLSIYHDQVSQCLETLGRIPEAITSAEKACNLVRDVKYCECLRARDSKN